MLFGGCRSDGVQSVISEVDNAAAAGSPDRQLLNYVATVVAPGAVLRWGREAFAPQIRLLPLPQIQKLADRSDVIFEVPKCSKMQIFGAPDPTS